MALTRETAAMGIAPSRLDGAAVAAIADPEATAFVCGSARFTLAMESYLLSAGQPEGSIRVERLGPSGEIEENETDE